MAKLDIYTMNVRVGNEKTYADLSLTAMFEAGDDEVAVIAYVEGLLRQQALRLKQEKFVEKIEQ